MCFQKKNYKELLRFKESPIRIEGRLRGREKYLKELLYIERVRYSTDRFDYDGCCVQPPSYQISPRGEDALAEFEKIHQQEAKAERQQSFENKISVASVLVPTATFLLGLLVEYFSDIVGTLLDVFS